MNCLGYSKIKAHSYILVSSRLIILLLFLILSSSCRAKSLNRPPGYFNLGKVSELLSPETNIEKDKLLLRRDERGFYVMSTMCTYDLTYLERKNVDGKDLLVSTYTDSKYDLRGKVISGPSTVNLPYYELKLDAGVYGGPKDTLYAYVGKEVSPDWRLEVK
jgi:nitrite reductase/ring-hydroxylating ferredoxin subunit